YRRIAQILRLVVDHSVEHHVREPLLLVARDQAAEDRVAVEAGIAPPHQARLGVDKRSRAPVADDGEIEPMIGHEAASASVRDLCSSQRRTSAGVSKQKSMPGTSRPTAMLIPSKSGMMLKTLKSVTSSPMKIGRRPANGW